MSATAPDLEEADAPLSDEAYQEAKKWVRLSDEARRIHWTLEGPLSTAIPPYFNKTEENWSPIWQSPLTEPKISSITVRIDQFEDWENQWLEFHRGCGEPGSHNEGNDQIRFGMLPDYNPDSDEEGPEHLLKCCDAERPRKKKVSLLVKATGKFVTIHDYVSVVHPWLMSLREDILRAEGDLLDNVPLPEDTRLLVDYPGSESVSFSEEKEWQKYKSKKQYDYYATLRKTG